MIRRIPTALSFPHVRYHARQSEKAGTYIDKGLLTWPNRVQWTPMCFSTKENPVGRLTHNMADTHINPAIDCLVGIKSRLADPIFMRAATDFQRLRLEVVQVRLDMALLHLKQAQDCPPLKKFKSQAQIMADHEANYDFENPPHRPGKQGGLKDEKITFLLDLENDLLADWGPADYIDKPCPKGCLRFMDPDWATHVKKTLYPFHSDADWHEYVQFCQDGHGDEWFFETEE